MYDTYIMRRTQIYLDEHQMERLVHRARACGVTASSLIREAVEAYLAGAGDDLTELQRQRAALAESFGAIPRLPDGCTYVDQVRDREPERERELDEQWRRG